ncbi:hypothetical protein AGABI2DRAFT_119000 [Agaricus bisporus var. bisporus H97]|uniref:hypothetical protein n=1 Tax=Agaricus bisporus var. bisporus (strain H97 / ATCC MYA-4626 / FGSC 10389) TaxID=936046 RepID=UPI00029F78E7|nr:hypothetical protein AGABI2DRAFT_119000 [Agaricus bisporus var. bisporus H97]EKV46820.1 hypothetical protein AGABI2DRAFT_119000 [Agaricus bisporus var. bisporus H97]
MADPVITPFIKELAKALQISRNVNYATLAGLVTAYFDWLLTFDSEVRLIWNANGVKIKVLYMITRYLPLVCPFLNLYYRFGDATTSECDALYKAGGTMFAVSAIGAALIVTLRTWAIWATAKPVIYALFGIVTVTVVLCFVLLFISWRDINHLTVALNLPFGCIPRYGSIVPAAFLVEAAYDLVILLLLVTRAASLCEHFPEQLDLSSSKRLNTDRWGRNSPLFQTVFYDGILLYVYITVVSVANVVLLFSNSDYEPFLLPIQGTLRSVLSCRIVLHIRMKDDELVRDGLPTMSTCGPSTVQINSE